MSDWTHSDVTIVTDQLLSHLGSLNIIVKLGIELEFYLRQNDATPSREALADFAKHPRFPSLEKERGVGQYEFALPYAEARSACVAFHQLKTDVAIRAAQCGLQVIWLPKPFATDYGSAMHLHISLHNRNDDNLFAVQEEFMHNTIYALLDLVETDLDFICDSEDLIRLQAGWMAPSHLSWGGNNRSVVIRIPTHIPAHRRIEFRLPSANADINKVVLFILYAITISPYQQTAYTKIYGNAHDPQYNLPKLQFCNNILKKRLTTPLTMATSLEKVLNDRII